MRSEAFASAAVSFTSFTSSSGFAPPSERLVEACTVKRLGPGSTPDTFTLIPTNKSPEYVAQEIDKADILHVYQVIGCMKKF